MQDKQYCDLTRLHTTKSAYKAEVIPIELLSKGGAKHAAVYHATRTSISMRYLVRVTPAAARSEGNEEHRASLPDSQKSEDQVMQQ
jgi:hypothetical protein